MRALSLSFSLSLFLSLFLSLSLSISLSLSLPLSHTPSITPPLSPPPPPPLPLTRTRWQGRGGGVFADSDTRLGLEGWNRLGHNEAGSHGGAVFSLSEIALSPDGHTSFRGNKAMAGQGGALVAVDATVHVARGHSFSASGNSAALDGGAVALLAGAWMAVAPEAALNFTNNVALAGDGGAVFRDSEGCSRLEDSCFLDGLGGDGQGVVFGRNRAGKAGGAAHVKCARLGAACDAGLLGETRSAVGAGGVAVLGAGLLLRGNSAGLYGNDVATASATLEWARGHNTTQQSVAPGLQTLSVAVERRDDLHSLVRGTGATASFVVCGAGVCSEESGVVPATLEPFDAVTGGSSVALDVECLLGSNTAVVRVAVLGAPEPHLQRELTVACRCPATPPTPNPEALSTRKFPPFEILPFECKGFGYFHTE